MYDSFISKYVVYTFTKITFIKTSYVVVEGGTHPCINSNLVLNLCIILVSIRVLKSLQAPTQSKNKQDWQRYQVYKYTPGWCTTWLFFPENFSIYLCCFMPQLLLLTTFIPNSEPNCCLNF